MKDVTLSLLVLICGILLFCIVFHAVLPLQEQYVYGHIRIRSRGIYVQVFMREESPACGCCGALYGGGKVTVKEDLSQVQVGDFAEITSLEGERLVLECIDIRAGVGWLAKARGDVLVINDRLIFRFTKQ